MAVFFENDPSLQSYWRSIVLYGRNVASYKFALAKSLIDLKGNPDDLIKLEDLAVPFSKHLCEHLKHNDKQIISKSSTFLNACRKYNSNEIDLDEMQIQLEMFLGEHNFTSFRSSSCNSKNPIKKVTFVDMKTIDNFIIVTIAANAFLQNMVRIMVGTLIDIAKQENKLSVMDILKKENRSYAGKTLPASGLFFLGPSYKENLNIESLEHNLFDRLKI